jgi:hypothetical protein
MTKTVAKAVATGRCGTSNAKSPQPSDPSELIFGPKKAILKTVGAFFIAPNKIPAEILFKKISHAYVKLE